MPSRIKTQVADGSPSPRLPLPTLLSQVLVAFTIEFDNEFESQMPHRTTRSSAKPEFRRGPWLVSLVMWSNLMRFVGEEGTRVGELQDRGGNLAGMERWGYVTVEPDRGGSGATSSSRSGTQLRRDWVVHATASGRKAQQVWLRLFGAVETRWEERFGKIEIATLRESLRTFVSQFDFELPEYLPVLGYGLRAKLPHGDRKAGPGRAEDDSLSRLPLSALLSKVLFAFAIEFDRESELPLAICANVIRILSEKGVPVRDLPRLSGVSKEAIKMCLGFLEKGRYIAVESSTGASRGKSALLTAKGRIAQDAYRELLAAIEERWLARFGKDRIRNLRESLERLVGEPTAHLSPLFRGLEPRPAGWRASVPKPDVLPHYPMVLHRGGYPDGS